MRRFSLGGHELGVLTEKGGSLSIFFQNFDLILRGTAIASNVTSETIINRSVSPGRAVLSGGMMLTRTARSVRVEMLISFFARSQFENCLDWLYNG